MPAPYSNSELLWRLFRRRFCRRSSGAQDSSWTKRLVSRLSHSEKHPAEPEVEGDAGISLPWGFWHHVHARYDSVEGRIVGLPDGWETALYPHKETKTSDDSIPIILEAVELLPSALCPHHDSCPFRNLDFERSYLVFKEDGMDLTLHLPRPCME